MTDLATALASKRLTDFEGLPVIASGIEIPSAAGGLQPAMRIDPEEFRQGEVVHVVYRCIVGKVRHEPIVKDEPTGAQRRVHIFAVTDTTIIDGDTVKDAIDAQRLKIAKAREAGALAKGQATLPGTGWDDQEAEALLAEHLDGQHADDLRDGCPRCAEERDAIAAEQDGADDGA